MISLLQIIGGLVLLVLGGEALVRGAASIAKTLGLPTFIIGLTFVAYGTSSPEMAITLQAALNGHPDIAIGNVVGSNISNILLVLGLSAAIFPIAIKRSIALRDSIVMMLVATILAVLSLSGSLSTLSGIIFLSILFLHSGYIFYAHKKGLHVLDEEELSEDANFSFPLWLAIIACVVGTILLATGGNILVKGAVSIATIIGVPDSVIGLTIVALGGSLPELTASVIAALRKKSDIAIGNIIGSNIVNITGILGLTAIFTEIPISSNFINIDIPIMILATIALLAAIIFLKNLSRIIGACFLIGYISYVAALFV